MDLTSSIRLMPEACGPESLIQALLSLYAQGVFPMADARDDHETYWVDPPQRGIIPLESFNLPRSLKKFMDGCDYTVTVNRDFAGVIAACASVPRADGGTWINHEIEGWFNLLHRAGHAHSIEVWGGDGALIGGLYGLAQGGCFNGESMFSKAPNASKIALVHLVDRLRACGFTLLDTQFVNDHLRQFGCIEISREVYHNLLARALSRESVFFI